MSRAGRKEFEANGQRIGETAARMAEMVQNLLDANRIERGEMQLDLARTDLAAAVAAVLETQRPRAVAKQQTLHCRTNPGPFRCWPMRPCSRKSSRTWFPTL